MINLVNHQCQADFANTTHIAAPSDRKKSRAHDELTKCLIAPNYAARLEFITTNHYLCDTYCLF